MDTNLTHPSAAELADFRADLASAPLTSPPPMAQWALRLASVLAWTGPGAPAAASYVLAGSPRLT
jgi:hypothetical protein